MLVGVDGRFTLRTLVGERIIKDMDEPVSVNSTFVTTFRARERRLVARLALNSGGKRPHFPYLASDRYNHVACRPDCCLVTDSRYDDSNAKITPFARLLRI